MAVVGVHRGIAAGSHNMILHTYKVNKAVYNYNNYYKKTAYFLSIYTLNGFKAGGMQPGA